MIRLNQGLAWRDFDGEIVVYHEETGNSFLLSGMAAQIFAAIRAEPIAPGALMARFCPDGATTPGEAREVFEASLKFLAELEAVHLGPVA